MLPVGASSPYALGCRALGNLRQAARAVDAGERIEERLDPEPYAVGQPVPHAEWLFNIRDPVQDDST
jgi:hypothetical protein